MKNQKEHPLWEKEFLEFIDAQPLAPPPHLSKKVETEIEKYQMILRWVIISKFALIHAVFAIFTLFFCPQFEIGFTKYDHLAALVQHNHGIGFMAVCGALFLSGGAVLATIFLNIHEIQIIEKSEWIYFPAATLIALLMFYFLGSDLQWIRTLPWFLGGAIGSIICFEITKKINLKLRSKPV